MHNHPQTLLNQHFITPTYLLCRLTAASLTCWGTNEGGVVSLTRTLALELGKRGITVNCIAPGLIETPLFLTALQEIQQKLLKAQPTGKIGTPYDIANAVAFFAADEASYITGQTIFVCGGKSLFANIV